jgi:hypothetical protein
MKNYIGFVNDHSGSMQNLARAALTDYNAQIAAVKNAANTEMLDTVVSVVGVGVPGGSLTKRQVVISNPHVLRPMTSWPTNGGTPLFDGIADLVNLFKGLPDATDTNVSFLVLVTTDGEEAHSTFYNEKSLTDLINSVKATGRWSFVARVPSTANQWTLAQLERIGFPKDNIQKWDTTEAGMAASTQVTTTAMGSFFAARSAGATASSSFYANAAQVNLAVLEDISKKVSLYVVDPADEGIQIRDFILKHRMEYLKGAAFYQLSKTEAKVSHTKLVLVREKVTGKIYSGKEARQMIGLPTDRNARLHPGDHKNFDLFIQSESVNRKLVGGSGVVYWKELGVPFTAADLAYLQPKAPVAAPTAPVQLLQVPVSTTPTKSPIPVTPNFRYFETREDARMFCGAHGIVQTAILKNSLAPKGRKWSVPSALMKVAGKAQGVTA